MERLNLCCGCMEPIDEAAEVCRNCGYHVGAPHLPSYLEPGIMLNDRYFVGKLLSYNGESANYIAFDTITETKIMIKEYMPESICVREKNSSVIRVNPDYMAQYKTFLSEFVELNKMLSKMRTLNHVNAAIDMFGDNNTAYAVFGWLDGVTLGEYIKQSGGELSWNEVKRLFPPIFTTLSLVHNAGLVHRGISPENIVVTEKGELMLTGFCIADARTANTELVSELYNGYAAPEQYSSNGWQGTWTDVYGISALLYRILTGITPTDAASRKSSDTLIEPMRVDHTVPKHVSRVIMNGMSMNGETRIQTITELVTQLFEQPEPGSARLSSSSTQTISIPRQRTQGRKQAAPSRHGVFIAVIVSILAVGFAMIWLIIKLDDVSTGGTFAGSYNEITTISGTESDALTETTAMSLQTMTEPPQTTSAGTSANAMVYVMNDLNGKLYDVISKSDAYSSLVFSADYEYNDDYAKGLIFEQSIEAGSSYEDGAEITVKVSMGPKYITIPDFLGMSKKDYFAKLNELGIKYEEQERETSDTLEGYVDGVSKDPGKKIDAETGEILTVYIAKNPPKTEPDIPDYDPELDDDPDLLSDDDEGEIGGEQELSVTFFD